MTIPTIPRNEGDQVKINETIRRLAEEANAPLASDHGSYSNGFVNGALAVSAGSSALTIAVKTLAGSDPSVSDPVDVVFRNVTGTSGDYVTLTLTAATSLVVSSGSTLGVSSSTAFRLWIVGFNDAGTFRLGVINCATSTQIYPLVEGIASSTAEGGAGAADSAGTIYTGTAVSSKAMRILGYAEWSSSGLTAGTWTTTNLLRVQLMGPGVPLPGQILQAIQLTNLTETTTTSNAYQSTALSQAVALSSAANFAEVSYAGMGFSAGPGVILFVALHRDSTKLAPVLTLYNNVAVGSHCPIYMDRPNTTSSVTYTVKLRNSDNATTVYFPETTTYGADVSSSMLVREIMA